MRYPEASIGVSQAPLTNHRTVSLGIHTHETHTLNLSLHMENAHNVLLIFDSVFSHMLLNVLPQQNRNFLDKNMHDKRRETAA